MNYETLNRLVRKSGKTKRTISAECGISRMTLDTILAGGDMKVSILEALGHAHGSRVTGIYVQFAREKVDAANRRVLDFVNGG